MLKGKRVTVLLSLLAAAVLCFALSAASAFAADNYSDLTPAKKAELEKELGMENYFTEGDPYQTGRGVHIDPTVFEKDFSLTPAQKAYTITEMERVVSEIIDPQMSDLEKYYTLAIWVNKHVQYDWSFWSGGYHLEYYSHQWDSYGGMKEDEKSICLGIAIFYANMCHAAGLPCKYLRIDPKYLDHVINYIPNINDHAYLVDVTENCFVMSEHSTSAFSYLDKEFSNITKDADDETFDYAVKKNGDLTSSTIKDYYNTPFDTWFNEFALHKDTKKIFKTPYVEKGSGERGKNYASYGNYDSNRTKTPGIWFMDDFYKDPADISEKVLAGQFDDQVIILTGVKNGYDCTSAEDLMSKINSDIANEQIKVDYFPSVKNGVIVAETAGLKKDKDYTLNLDYYNENEHTAQFTLTGTDQYSGTHTFTVMINSAVVEKDPLLKSGLVYDVKSQKLILEGKVSHGELQYAKGTETEPTEAFSTEIPSAVDAGAYYIWYQAVGDPPYASTPPKRLERAAVVSRSPVELRAKNIAITVGQTAKATPTIDRDMDAAFRYYTLNDDLIKIDQNGNITGRKAGQAYVIINADLGENSQNYRIIDWAFIKVDVTISIKNAEVALNKSSFVYNGKVQKPAIKTVKGQNLKAGTDYTFVIKNSKGKNVSSPKAAGTYKVVVKGKGKYSGSTAATYTIKKAANPMTLKAKSVKVKRKTLKKKSKTIAGAEAFTVSKAKGKLSYKLVSVKKGKKSFKKKFNINAKTGKITVKKKLKKGTYTVKVKVKAAGNANYKASAWKTVTFKVKVK